MSKVVEFPRADRGTIQIQRERKRAFQLRADLLKKNLEDRRSRSMSRRDQEAVAIGVWHLLNRLEDRSISKALVLREAGIGNDTDSTKHLGQYALDPNRTTEDRASLRLRKKPGAYLKIVETAARLGGWDRDELLLEVFSKTSLSVSEGGRVAAPEFEDLAQTLNAIADAISTKHCLQSYFRAVARDSLCLTVATIEREAGEGGRGLDEFELEFSRHEGGVDWPIEFRAESDDACKHDCWGRLPAYPSILLGAWQIGEDFPVEIESDEQPRNGEFGPFAGRTKGYYQAELRFCIVPIGPDLRPEAALRINVCASVYPLERRTSEPDEWDDGIHDILRFEDYNFLECSKPMGVFATVASTNRTISCRLRCGPASVPTLIERYCRFKQDGFRPLAPCRFLPITGDVLEDWLSLPERNNHWHVVDKPEHLRALGEPLLDTLRSQPRLSEFIATTLASALDDNLVRQNSSNLLTLLDKRAEHFVNLLGEAREAQRAERNAGMSRLRARLWRMLDKENEYT